MAKVLIHWQCMDVALHCTEAQAHGRRYKPAACVGAKAKVPDRCTGYE